MQKQHLITGVSTRRRCDSTTGMTLNQPVIGLFAQNASNAASKTAKRGPIYQCICKLLQRKNFARRTASPTDRAENPVGITPSP
jgi:hypothetical protein